MKNLVHIYNEQAYKRSSYSPIFQRDFLDRLSDHDINITSQTLRNWQRNNLLTILSRSGQSGKKGLQVVYSEFALTEAFAVYSLVSAKLLFKLNGNDIPFPKYSLLHVEMARRAFCQSRYSIPNFPNPPEESYSVMYPNTNREELFKDLPPFGFALENDQRHSNVPLIMNSAELDKLLFFQGLYGAWFSAVKKGCETFFSSKKKNLYFC